MIIVTITEDLGNQMFEYALGRSLSFLYKTQLKLDVVTELKIDPVKFSKTDLIKFPLGRFKIKGDFATKEEINSLINIPLFNIRRYLPTKFQSIFFKLLKIKYPSLFFEKYFHFDKDLFKAGKNVYLFGYFQSEKYFSDIKEIIEKEFVLKKKTTGRNAEVLDKIRKTSSISIHFRRGDYIIDETVNKIHGTPTFSYYEQAISYLAKRIKNSYFFIFSDDIKWVKKNFKIKLRAEYLDINGPEEGYQDLRLMKSCKHNIIANSTFSWWAAWLNNNKKKIVIVPKRWFRVEYLNTKDLIPESWLRM